MLKKPSTCSGCELENAKGGFSIPEGTCNNGVLIIGEALGEKELNDGLPFRPYAEAGSTLQTVFKRLKIDRNEFALWNLIACLTWGARVVMPDGSKRRIAELVKENYSGEVLSFNLETQQFIPKKVIKAFRNLRGKRKLYRVSYEGAKNSPRGIVGTTATEEHLFLTSEGWVRADSLNGKLLNIGAEDYRERATSTIIGTMLGDSHIQANSGNLVLTHCKKQLEWLQCKAKVLGAKEPRLRSNRFLTFTKATASIRSLGNKFYNRQNKKAVPVDIYDLMTLQAIATWYLDDGYICDTRYNRQRIKIRRKSPLVEFATCSFSKEEVDRLIKSLAKFNIIAYKRLDDKLFWRIHLDGENTNKLIKLIGKFVPPSMRYKLGGIDCEEYDPLVWEFEGKKAMFSKAIVIEVKPRREDQFVYCLEIEDTNNFITLAGVTHNCRPPFNNLAGAEYEYQAINHCQVHFDQVINHYKNKIKCIFACGNLPLRHLVPEIDDLHQVAKANKDKSMLKKLSITSLRGYQFQSKYGIPLVASFHPSFVNQTGRIYSGVLQRDLYHALQVARENVKEFKTNYILNPTLEQVEKFYDYCKRNIEESLGYDIETTDTVLELDESEINYKTLEVRDIKSIQFSIKEGEAIFVPWTDPFLFIIAKILKLGNDKISWNGRAFDDPLIEYHLGKDAIGGNKIDLMLKWKHGNPDFVKIGRSLQFVANFYAPEFPAWKHLSEKEPEFYGCCDVDVLKRIDNGLHRDLSNKKFLPNTKTLEEGFKDDILKLIPILEDIENRGLPIDVIARDKFRKQLEIEIEKTFNDLQSLYPDELRNIYPREGYKRKPSEIEDLVFEFNKLINDPMSIGFRIYESSYCKQQDLERFIESNTKLDKEVKKQGMGGLVLREFNLEGSIELRYCRIEEFKPSTQQIVPYLKYKKYKIPKKRNDLGEDKDTTEKDQIAQLAEETGDELLTKIVLYRELRKMLSTYVGKDEKTGWKLGQDNRVHTSFTMIPATGQLSSRNPNIQNCVSEDTELLTLEGWKLFSNLSKIDLVAQFNLQTKLINFSYPIDYIEGKSESINEIYSANSADFLLTDEHNCYVINPITTKFERVKAKNYPSNKYRHQVCAGKYIKGNISYNEAQIILIAALQADGTYNTKIPLIEYRFKKPRKINRLRQALKSLDLIYTEGKVLFEYSSFTLRHDEIPDWLKNKKTFGNWILNLDYKSLLLLRKELGFWDGDWSNEELGKSPRYNTIVKINADWAQIIFILTNRKAILSKYKTPKGQPYYKVGSSQTNYFETRSTTSSIKKYDGKVYCVTMPEGTIIIRRNGKVMITGNSPARGTRYSSPGYKELATSFRKIIAAAPKKVILSADWNSFHALTLGFEAEDETYMRLVRSDVHSYVAAWILNDELPRRFASLKRKAPLKDKQKWLAKLTLYEEAILKLQSIRDWLDLSDDELKDQLKWIKTNFKFTRDSQAKPAILGMGFGMEVNKFYKMNRYSFASKSEPQKILDLVRSLFPLTFIEYPKRILGLADRQTYLISRYGYIRRFYDVFDYRLIKEPKTLRLGESQYQDKKGRWWLKKKGQSANDAIAFLPSNDAFGFKKEAMRELWNHPSGNLVQSYGLINEIHDDLLFEVEENKLEEACRIVKEVMERPAKFLINSVAPQGLVTKVSLKSGRNWGELREIEI